MSKFSKAFIDIYGVDEEISDSELSPLQIEVKRLFKPLISRVSGMEMHSTRVNKGMLHIYRPASSADEFEIILDVYENSYLMQFDGYEQGSDEVAPDDHVPEFLGNEVTAALSGQIKLKVISKRHAYKWFLSRLMPNGQWHNEGSQTDWPINPFVSKTEKEKVIHAL